MRVSGGSISSTFRDRESVGTASTNRPRVLIIDTDSNFIDLLTRALARNYVIVGAQDVAEFLKLRRASQFDIIVIDLGMPSNDGIEFIREIRDNGALKRIPLLALSSSPALRRHLHGSDVIAVLPKARWLEEISRSVKETLSQSIEKPATRTAFAEHRRGNGDGQPIKKDPSSQGARRAA